MRRPIPLANRCSNRSPDRLHSCEHPRDHHGFHESKGWPERYTWFRSPSGELLQERLGNRPYRRLAGKAA